MEDRNRNQVIISLVNMNTISLETLNPQKFISYTEPLEIYILKMTLTKDLASVFGARFNAYIYLFIITY